MTNKNTPAVIVSKSLKYPTKAGEYHRLLCMTGSNKGTSYYLNGPRLVMGRGKKVDIQVLDTKASREHAELVFYNGHYILTDLNSQNGIYVNDLKVTQHELTTGDKIIIGQNVYKYGYEKVADIPMVREDEEYDDEEYLDENERLDDVNVANGNTKKKKKLNPLILALFIGAVFLFLDESPTKNQSQGNKKNLEAFENDLGNEFQNLAREPVKEDKELELKLMAILHRGQREYREKNYFRAIHEFELALMLSPRNHRASYYLNKTKQALDSEIERNFNKSKQEVDSLKYQSAIVSYCAIIKLLEGYPEDERYKTAQKNIKLVYKKMGKDESEASCF